MTVLHEITVDGETIPLGELLPAAENALKTETGEPWLEAAIGQLAAIKTLLSEQEAPVVPFALNSDAFVTVPYQGTGRGELNAAVQTYFRDWQAVFLTNAIDLPTPFLEGHAYRQWCFHAWVGEALLRAVNVKSGVVRDAVG